MDKPNLVLQLFPCLEPSFLFQNINSEKSGYLQPSPSLKNPKQSSPREFCGATDSHCIVKCMFLVVKLMDSKASGFLNYSGRQKRQLKADDKSISTNELVRSVAAVLEKTDKWDVLLNELCAASASGITPSVAVQSPQGHQET